jgi:hypothetical protein
MTKKLLLSLPLLLMLHCITIGSIGYVVPEIDDSAEIGSMIGENCVTTGSTKILDEFNRKIRNSTNKASFENVGLKYYVFTGCLQLNELRSGK